MDAKNRLKWVLRLAFLTVFYYPIWILGTLAMENLIPDLPSEPGLIEEGFGLLVLGLINTALIVSLILTSRWNGWQLTISLALAYYGSFTLLTQIESWYFLSETTVPPQLLPRLFLMGLSIPFIFIPVAVFILGKWKRKGEPVDPAIWKVSTTKLLIIKFGIIALIYLVVYWLAGYFIAWQNPELREFYGSPGEIAPFFSHTLDTFLNSPSLVLLQLFRGIVFGAIALLILSGSKANTWVTALIVGLLFAIPHLVHILPNPLMPIASVRVSHMVETASSSFVFGLITVWVLQFGQK
ncbi:hypothetical protein [Pleomorphovibrio marinus]|uniref:hypothetical protein n=1 Tax=Pleomorphovibrio marinus TaxID=2164132 RepID=UPI0018E54866|nr:hypothetical protein [Pleomorphovibrio marinus]